MACIVNGDLESPLQLDGDVVKVVVIGEPRCGKTRFIRAYYDNSYPGEIYSHNGVRIYPTEFLGKTRLRRVSIFEIPGHPDSIPEQRIPHYLDADIIVFLYAIDDPHSLQMLTDRWIVETYDIILSEKIPVVFVGTKKDLRDNQQVIESLALQNKSPVTLDQGLGMIPLVPFSIAVAVKECATHDLQEVGDIFDLIFTMVEASE